MSKPWHEEAWWQEFMRVQEAAGLSMPSPETALALCFLALRGGIDVSASQLVADLDDWVSLYGWPTWESVRNWASGHRELRELVASIAERN